MIRLSNGRGQLGEKLNERFSNFPIEEDIIIYHTWKVPYLYNPLPGEEEQTQIHEYEKLIQCSQNNPNSKIIFVSTNSNRSTFYTYYKELSEAYLLLNHKNCVILKFPVFIGKGIIQKIKNKEIEPYGITEVITLNKVVDTIEEYVTYNDLKRVFTIPGEKIEAKTISEILKV